MYINGAYKINMEQWQNRRNARKIKAYGSYPQVTVLEWDMPDMMTFLEYDF